MFFRPAGNTMIGLPDASADEVTASAGNEPLPVGEPVVAILDGLPLAGHESLRGRLRLEDPDDFAEDYEAHAQQHGTAMASLVIRGDLEAGEPPLPHPVYVRPVMKPVEGLDRPMETFPQDRLFVDLFHRAVRRIVKGDGDEAPVAPTVRIINVSLGNPYQPFIRDLSPLARLLDWLAWEHKLLFVVSAGNHVQDLALSISRDEHEQTEDSEAVQHLLQAMMEQTSTRRLISPAEALNVVTVGAVHTDAAGEYHPGQQIDLLRGQRLCSPISSVAAGFRRAVKPEILMPGGRQLYIPRLDVPQAAMFKPSGALRPPGQKVAAPGPQPGDLKRHVYTCGSSNAAALATRLAARIHDRLMELQGEPGGDRVTDELIPVLIKALLVHGASWTCRDSIDRLLDEALCVPMDEWQKRRETIAKFIGFGEVDPARTLLSNDYRVVLLGGDSIEKEQGHVYEIPIPVALSGKAVKRRIVVTLAWLSPINVRHRGYRRAHLYLTVNQGKHSFVNTTKEADGKLAGRGTVQHLVLEETDPCVIEDSDNLSIKVSCVEDAGTLEDSVPYGLAITMEVAPAAGIPIYERIRERIRPRARVRSA